MTRCTVRRRCLQAGCPSCDWTEAADDSRKEFWRGVEERRALRQRDMWDRMRLRAEDAERELRETDPTLN